MSLLTNNSFSNTGRNTATLQESGAGTATVENDRENKTLKKNLSTLLLSKTKHLVAQDYTSFGPVVDHNLQHSN